MKFPGQLEAEYAVRGLWVAAIGVIVCAALAIAAVQTARIEGWQLLFIEREGLKPQVHRLEAVIRTVREIQRGAATKAQAANARVEQTYSTIARGIDDHARTEIPRQLAAADRFIASNRVREPAIEHSPSGAAPAANDHRAADPDRTGAATQLDDAGNGDHPVGGTDMVLVPPEDVRICTINTIKAEAGHAMAIGLSAASRAPDGDVR